jgi:hypothetical protein
VADGGEDHDGRIRCIGDVQVGEGQRMRLVPVVVKIFCI